MLSLDEIQNSVDVRNAKWLAGRTPEQAVCDEVGCSKAKLRSLMRLDAGEAYSLAHGGYAGIRINGSDLT